MLRKQHESRKEGREEGRARFMSGVVSGADNWEVRNEITGNDTRAKK